jgi:demethylmenaquinone methyltransferase / 2-methoxy-6-polyprenyl-1,4-benzoquinol methylase
MTATPRTEPGTAPGGLARSRLPSGAAKTAYVHRMFDAVAPRYDLVNRIISLGQDQLWRRLAVDALALAPGSVVLDVACGTGGLSRVARRRGFRSVGTDLSWGMLAANTEPGALVQSDVARLPFPDASMDGAVCGYALRNFTDLSGALREIGRVVRPGGRLSVLEVGDPPSGPLRLGYQVWFEHIVPLVGRLLSERDAYQYLPRSTAYLPTEAALRKLLVEGGFSTVGRRLLSGGLSQLFTATRLGLPRAATLRPGLRPAPRGGRL